MWIVTFRKSLLTKFISVILNDLWAKIFASFDENFENESFYLEFSEIWEKWKACVF